MQRTRCLLISTVLIAMAGCSRSRPYKAFQGDKEVSTLSIIEGESDRRYGSFHGPDHVMISSVDGKSTGDIPHWFLIGMEYPEQVMVEPGRRYLGVQWSHGRSYSNARLWLDAEAGKTYVVRKQHESGRVRFWIEEKESKAVVGGVDMR